VAYCLLGVSGKIEDPPGEILKIKRELFENFVEFSHDMLVTLKGVFSGKFGGLPEEVLEKSREKSSSSRVIK